jgi:hypothetical protein
VNDMDSRKVVMLELSGECDIIDIVKAMDEYNIPKRSKVLGFSRSVGYPETISIAFSHESMHKVKLGAGCPVYVCHRREDQEPSIPKQEECWVDGEEFFKSVEKDGAKGYDLPEQKPFKQTLPNCRCHEVPITKEPSSTVAGSILQDRGEEVEGQVKFTECPWIKLHPDSPRQDGKYCSRIRAEHDCKDYAECEFPASDPVIFKDAAPADTEVEQESLKERVDDLWDKMKGLSMRQTSWEDRLATKEDVEGAYVQLAEMIRNSYSQTHVDIMKLNERMYTLEQAYGRVTQDMSTQYNFLKRFALTVTEPIKLTHNAVTQDQKEGE